MGSPMISALNRIGDGFDKIGDGIVFIAKNSGELFAPPILGAISAGFVGNVGRGRGFCMGAISVLGFWGLRPIGEWIEANSGKNKGKLNYNAQAFLYTTGTVIGIALPVLLTQKFGYQIMSAVSGALPRSISWMVEPSNVEFSFLKGLLFNIVPPLAQFAIAELRKEDPREKALRKGKF